MEELAAIYYIAGLALTISRMMMKNNKKKEEKRRKGGWIRSYHHPHSVNPVYDTVFFCTHPQ